MTGPLSRRRALSSAATLGVGVPLLAACGDDGSSTASDPSDRTPSAPSSSAPAADAESSTGTDTPAAAGLVATSEVPVGGGVVVQEAEVVVTQPTAGEFKAFTAICTHQGCLVSSVDGGKIICACHASSFEITDGAVAGGPASAPLAEVPVTVEGDRVVQS